MKALTRENVTRHRNGALEYEAVEFLASNKRVVVTLTRRPADSAVGIIVEQALFAVGQASQPSMLSPDDATAVGQAIIELAAKPAEQPGGGNA